MLRKIIGFYELLHDDNATIADVVSTVARSEVAQSRQTHQCWRVRLKEEKARRIADSCDVVNGAPRRQDSEVPTRLVDADRTRVRRPSQ